MPNIFQPLTIEVLLFPDFQLLDATGPVAVFEAADYFARGGGDPGDGSAAASAYAVRLVSPDGGLVPSSSGVALATAPLGGPAPDTLLVPGGTGTRRPDLDPAVVRHLRRRAPRCRRVASVCTGAFLLAAGGLLDGRRATTHWRHGNALARRFPAVDVVADRIWVNDGPYWTSAGVSAGIDLALALVADDFGEAVARACAREVVVYYRRPGGQSQFSSIEELSRPRGRFAPLLAWVRSNLQHPLRVEDLAAQAAMSPRNFSRRFREEVGRTPAQAVAQLRLEVARAHLESSDRPIEAIARDTGFGDGETMRRAFVRLLGQSPRTVRTAARGRGG